MMMSTVKVGMLGTIVLITLTPAAMANAVTIATDRVQVQVGNNGQVTIQSLAERPLVLPQTLTVPQGRSSSLLPTFAPRCTARSHSSQATRSTPGGSVVYSENRSTTRLCQ